MTSDIDPGIFEAWLDEQDGPLPREAINNEYGAAFPWCGLIGVTCPIIKGEIHYYKADLLDAVRHGGSTD